LGFNPRYIGRAFTQGPIGLSSLLLSLSTHEVQTITLITREQGRNENCGEVMRATDTAGQVKGKGPASDNNRSHWGRQQKRVNDRLSRQIKRRQKGDSKRDKGRFLFLSLFSSPRSFLFSTERRDPERGREEQSNKSLTQLKRQRRSAKEERDTRAGETGTAAERGVRRRTEENIAHERAEQRRRTTTRKKGEHARDRTMIGKQRR